MIKPLKSQPPYKIRLNKFISSSGFAARRKADDLIKDGRVAVNSSVVTELGTKIDPAVDTVRIDGETVKTKSGFVYILLNKPKGYVTTTSDEKNRPTVLDLINIKKRIYPVGRLDFDTEGLLLLTDDGDLAYKLMHPKFLVNKTYLAKLNKPLNDKNLFHLIQGVSINGRKTSEASISIVPDSGSKLVRISIHEGRNRQVKKMFESVGLYVRKLKRIEYANLKISSLRPGTWRLLITQEIEKLKMLCDSASSR